jgi:hypothetical protein
MENNKSADRIENDGNQDRVDIPKPENNPTGESAEKKSGRHPKNEDSTLGVIRAAEHRMIWLTAAMAFFALCGVVVGILQWITSSGQKSTMDQTLESMFAQTRVMQGQLEQMKETSILTRQQVVGTQSAIVNAPDAQITEDPVTRDFEVVIRVINLGHVTALNIHGSVTITIMSFPDLKAIGAPRNVAIRADRLRAIGEADVWSKTIPLPGFSIKDRDYITQKMSVMVKGGIEYDNGFGVISKRTMCSEYLGRYSLRYPDGSMGSGGGLQVCDTFPDLIRFLQAPTNAINRQ